ncbi:MAG: TonB-dependent receptor [candidate division KSB1 bacterium]|nr:TonB-dependent receptor [candidate division KSB1 bacterium]
MYKTVLYCIVLLFLFFANLLFAQTGTITGKIVDSETGEALIGVNVILQGTMIGDATDMDGEYRIKNAPVGDYTVMGSYMGYSRITIQDVAIRTNQVVTLNFTMTMESLQGEEVVVTAKAVRNTEAALLKDRQKAKTISDAISAEMISESGSGNAAEAMKQITGASVVDGKKVFVRGLGDRYTSTQLNGAEIPSADPYSRSGSIDIIPSNLIDNIVTVKSFTPDKPGNFSGGTVDIQTKDFPEDLSLSFSASSSFNSQTTFNDNILALTNGSSLNWLGFADKGMDIPDFVGKDLTQIDPIAAGKNAEQAQFIENYTDAFNHSMAPTKGSAPLNQSYSFSVGNQVEFLGRPLGFLASATYSNKHKSYDDGVYARYALKALSENASGLENIFHLSDQKTQAEVLWGVTLKSSYKLNKNNKLSFTGLYNQNGVSTARKLSGPFPYDLNDDEVYQVSTQQYNERSLHSYQLDGDHKLQALDAQVSWKASYGRSTQDEPDLRYFTSYINGQGTYGTKTNIPQERFYRYLDEDRYEGNLDITKSLSFWNGLKGSVKWGGAYAFKTRDFDERRFVYEPNSDIGVELRNAGGDINELFSDENLGLTGARVAPNGNVYNEFGIYITETAQISSNYTGDQYINAGYAMLDMPLSIKLRLVGGVRYETTEMQVISEDPEQPKGTVSTQDLLPSANLIYTLSDNMNIRFAYGKTLARPSFREISNFASYDFKEGDKYIGNPELKRTLVDNFDLRWEWFSRPGELYAVSVFSKSFTNPIEIVIKNNNYWITWQNVDQATTFGVEFEARKRLDILHSALSNFMAGGNLSLIYSEVDISDRELEIIRATNPEAEASRPFQGQSPYLLNLNISYDNPQNGLATSLYYNIFGERLAAIGKGGTPDIYEQPAAMLNYSLSKRIGKHLYFKFAVNNILDANEKKMHEFKEKDYITTRYQRGRTFSLGLKYNL